MRRRGTLLIEQMIPQPVERVWQALTDSNQLAVWAMENDFQPVLGHRFQFRSADRPGWNGVANCEVTELNEPWRLTYTWSSEQELGVLTVVTWRLEPVPGGTKLILEHKGFHGLGGEVLSIMHESGWKLMLEHHLPAIFQQDQA